MRVIIILILVVIALAMLRNLVRDVSRAASKAWKSGESNKSTGDAANRGKLERDPETGAYVDPQTAPQAKVGGRTFYFESEASRDRFVKKRAS